MKGTLQSGCQWKARYRVSVNERYVTEWVSMIGTLQSECQRKVRYRVDVNERYGTEYAGINERQVTYNAICVTQNFLYLLSEFKSAYWKGAYGYRIISL